MPHVVGALPDGRASAPICAEQVSIHNCPSTCRGAGFFNKTAHFLNEMALCGPSGVGLHSQGMMILQTGATPLQPKITPEPTGIASVQPNIASAPMGMTSAQSGRTSALQVGEPGPRGITLARPEIEL